MSTMLKGAQMPPVLEALGIDVAMFGASRVKPLAFDHVSRARRHALARFETRVTASETRFILVPQDIFSN